MTDLSELFGKTELEKIGELWDATPAADDNAPIPSGIYEMEAVKGEIFKSRTGTPGYKISWRVVDGEHEGCMVWQDLWLTKPALPMTKRALAKLGITKDQLEKPLPDGIVCKVQVVLRESDTGKQFNDVQRIEHLRTIIDPFAPADKPAEQPADKPAEQQPASGGGVVVEPEPPTKPKQPMTKEQKRFLNAQKIGGIKPRPILPPTRPTEPEADYVQTVSKAIPVGMATKSAEISKCGVNETYIRLALGRLHFYGLKCIVIDGTYAYWWEGERPVFETTPTEPEMNLEEFKNPRGSNA